jgi:hypothetical protein
MTALKHKLIPLTLAGAQAPLRSFFLSFDLATFSDVCIQICTQPHGTCQSER